MAEARLESIVSRLEKVVAQLESGGGHKSAASEAGSSLPSLDDFNGLVTEFEQLGNKLDLIELHEITAICVHAFNAMKKVMQFSTVGKATPDQKKEIQSTMMGILKKIGNYSNNPKVNHHAKAVGDAMNCVFWVVNDAPEILMKGCIESSEFYVLKVRNLKVQPHTKWIDTLISSLKNLTNYVKTNYSMGLSWNVKGTADFKALLSDLENNEQKVAAAVKTDQPVPNRAALFQQLNQGDNITSNLKKVTPDMKNKPVQDVPKRVSISKKEEKKEAAPVKPPRKHKAENWFVENFVDEKLIEFPESECDIKESIFIDNCKNLCIMVNGKVKSIFVSKCSKINVVFKSVLSTVEVVNSIGAEIVCIDSAPTINIDKSESIHVCLPPSRNSDVVSSKTSSLNITYKLPDGDYEKDCPVPEQLVTRWDESKKKFVSKPLDLFI